MIRGRFQQQLNALRTRILEMGTVVDEELQLAMQGLTSLDPAIVAEINALDERVNQMRFTLEEECFTLIVTQQPAAGDLRAIVSVMNMIVDLERMGDQAKGIGKVISRLSQHQIHPPQPTELRQMGEMVSSMLRQSMAAYRNDNTDLAKEVALQDDAVDLLFDQLFGHIMRQMAAEQEPAQVEAYYEFLRAARELERYGDLATNIAERVVYRVTGSFQEMNTDEV